MSVNKQTVRMLFFSSEGWREDPGWEVASRGQVPFQQPQLWTPSGRSLESNPGAEEEEEVEDEEQEDMGPVKRYLLISALDNILLRKQPINWIH